MLPPQQTESVHRLPTALLILHRPSSVQLQPSDLPYSGRGDRQGGRKCRLGPGNFGRLPGSFKTLATRQGGESSSTQELWQTSRRTSSMVINGHRSVGRRVKASGEWDRRCGQIAHPSGTSERRSFPSPQVRSLFCICWSRKKLRGLRHRHCQAIGEDQPLRGQGKGAESEELVA